MKRTLPIGILLAAVGVGLSGCSDRSQPTEEGPSFGLAKGTERVAICHKGATITVAAISLAAHFAHGDGVEPPPGLVSWWPGDGTAQDIRNGNDGQELHGVSYASGFVGQAFSFDGFDDLVLVPDNANLNFGKEDDFTIDAWVNLQDATLANDHEIVNKVRHSPGGFSNGYAFRVARGDARLVFSLVRDVGFTSFNMSSNSAIPLNEWTHVAAVRQGNMGLVYINGTLDASAELTDESVANTWQLSIGGIYDTRFSPPVQKFGVFDGLLDEVEIFNRALTASVLRHLFEAGSAGKCRS